MAIPTASTTEPIYVQPLRYRRLENLHIVFWLVKDLSWCLLWRWLGIAMIFPTLLIAITIAWRNRDSPADWAHNSAIAVWIVANSYWMVSEFLGFAEHAVWKWITYKHLAVIPFVIGIIILLFFYLSPEKRNAAARTSTV